MKIETEEKKTNKKKGARRVRMVCTFII